MNFWLSVIIGAGVTAFMYSKLSRRMGADNTKNLLGTLAGIFLFTTLFVFILVTYILGLKAGE